MPVYMGGSHRTTDMSLAANKRGGEEGMKRELQEKGRWEKVKEESENRNSISAKY